jgi:hypothetical protein
MILLQISTSVTIVTIGARPVGAIALVELPDPLASVSRRTYSPTWKADGNGE